MNEHINIAFVTDENYFNYMLVAFKSIVSTVKATTCINFYILDTGIKEKQKSVLKNVYRDEKYINIYFVDVEMANLNDFKIKTHVSTAAFSKIYIADLINVDKIIYLDCDLMVNEDISSLWNQFEENVPLKAVWNPFYNYDNRYIGLPSNARTFNSGVMLLNLNMLRSMNASKLLLDFLNNYNDKTKLHDQAAFNAVFKNEWQELNYRWNYQVSMILSDYKKLEISREEYFDLFNKPWIVHFTSNSKPWQLRSAHPYKEKYREIYFDDSDHKLIVDNYLTDMLKKFKEYIRYRKIYKFNSK